MPGFNPTGKLKLVSEGTLTADGSEQTVFEMTQKGAFEGWIDLSKMAGGDVTEIKLYVKTKTGGDWRLYDPMTYSGAQPNPALHIIDVVAISFKVTLQQTAGIYKTYDYQIFRRL